MKILCSNPKVIFDRRKQEISDAISQVIDSGIYINGKSVSTFEKNFAEYIGVNYSIGVSSGTSAIELVLRSLDLKSSDEVITVSHTAVATVSAIKSANLTPVLADIDAKTYTLCPESLQQAITSKTKAVILVHLYGQTSHLEKVIEICKKHSIALIEDCSQAHGSTWKGKKLGSFGIAGCFSCYPTKNLGALGDAGVITTNNKDINQKVSLMREYGWDSNRNSLIDGGNYRLDELQASILNVQLNHLDDDNLLRQKIASMYDQKLNSIFLRPAKEANSEHVYHLYVIQVPNRDLFIEFMNKHDIYPGIHYKRAVHQQDSFVNIKKVDQSNTDNIIKNIVSLPMYPGLSNQEVDRVCKVTNEYLEIL